jgi:hypothetical protein
MSKDFKPLNIDFNSLAGFFMVKIKPLRRFYHSHTPLKPLQPRKQQHRL